MRGLWIGMMQIILFFRLFDHFQGYDPTSVRVHGQACRGTFETRCAGILLFDTRDGYVPGEYPEEGRVLGRREPVSGINSLAVQDCHRLVGLPPIALLLQDGSVRADPLSHTVVLLREAATVSSKPG